MGLSLQISNLEKKYGSVTALHDFSIGIEDGDFLVLLGPSGCGKTTLLRCLAGLEEPNNGEIVIGDKIVYSKKRGINIPPGQRELGLVFQNYALWPHMTVDQNISFGLETKRLSKEQIERQVEEALRDVRMTPYARRYPRELSGGQQQRVALARMLATRPNIFLMDEPLSNLDARLRMDMRFEIKRLHHTTNATTVYVTHDQHEALTMATHIAVLNEGQLQQVDKPEILYRTPENLFVADFIGNPKMNLLDAIIQHNNGSTRLDFGSFDLPFSSVNGHRQVVAAIRPEDITISLEPKPESVKFSVYSLLSTATEVMITANCGDNLLTIRSSSQVNLEIDQPLYLGIERQCINLYDKKVGKLIYSGEEPQ